MASARPLPSLPPRNLPPIFKEDEVNPSKPRHGKAKRKPKKAASTTEKSDVVKTNETRVAVPDVDGVGKKSHKKKKPTSDNTTRHLLTDNLSPDESEVDRRVPESVSTKKPKAGSTAKKLIAKMSTAQENTAFDNKADDESEAPQKKKKKRKKDKLVVDTYGQDEAMDITVLSDDVVTSEDEEEVGERLERSHVAAAQPRQHLGKLFVENERGFQMRDWTQHENRPQALDLVPLGVDLPSSTPQDLAVYTQKVFRTFAVFAHGLLAGFALWQCIVIYTLQERSSSYEDFVDHYCNVALPTNSLYYVLLIVSTVSVFDRYDVASPNEGFLRRMLTLQSAAIVIVLYLVALVLSVSIIDTDDRLNLYQYNATYWKNPAEASQTLDRWRSLNVARASLVILGWLVVSLRPGTDVLAKHLGGATASVGRSRDSAQQTNAFRSGSA